MCRKCSCLTSNVVADKVTLDGDVIATVAKFSYLGNVCSSGGGVQEADTARIRADWKNLRILQIC